MEDLSLPALCTSAIIRSTVVPGAFASACADDEE